MFRVLRLADALLQLVLNAVPFLLVLIAVLYTTPLWHLIGHYVPQGLPPPTSPDGYWECSTWDWVPRVSNKTYGAVARYAWSSVGTGEFPE